MGAFWGLCWKMLAPRWCFFGYLGRCCGILVPRWRTGAPRRGKIGELRRWGLLLGVGIHAAARKGPPCTPLRMDSPEWVSRLRLQTPTPTGTGSGKLEDWKTGSGKLEDWPSAGLYTQLCLRHGGGYNYCYISINVSLYSLLFEVDN